MVTATRPPSKPPSDQLGEATHADGVHSGSQFIIPRFYNGSNYPAGRLVGQSKATRFNATAGTHLLSAKSGFNAPGIIETEGLNADHDTGPSQWQFQTEGNSPAVLSPKLGRCTVAGYGPNWNNQNDVENAAPLFNLGASLTHPDPDKYHGGILMGMGGYVAEADFACIPGTGLIVRRNGTDLQNRHLEYDICWWLVEHINIQRVFRGLDYQVNDAFLGVIEVQSFRDYGVRIGSSTEGAVTGTIYGHDINCYGGGHATEPNGTGGAGIWIDGPQCRLDRIKGDHNPLACLVSNWKNHINGFTSDECPIGLRHKLAASYCVTMLIEITVPDGGVGIQNEGKHNTYSKGSITNGTGIGVNIDSTDAAEGLIIDDLLISNLGESGTCIKCPHPLKDAKIESVGAGGDGTVGLDLSGGDITGWTWIIWNTKSGEEINPIIWPNPSQPWTETETDTQTDVRINGRRYYPPAA